MQRRAITYLALGLGSAMILVGLLSFLGSAPRPEVATAGVTLLLASGLIGANGKR